MTKRAHYGGLYALCRRISERLTAGSEYVPGGGRGPVRGSLISDPTLRSEVQLSESDSRHRLADWFLQWQGPLRKFLALRRAVPAPELDDVAQEVFLRLMRYQRAELIDHPQAYLYKMAANVAAEWSIRARNAAARELTWMPGTIADDTASDEVDRKLLQQEIERALLTLSVRQRDALRLQYFEGLSRSETARRLGTSERAVKRILIKAYERLRQELSAELARGVRRGRR